MKTYAVKASEIDRQWWVVDANNQTLGRLATRIVKIGQRPGDAASMVQIELV